jgi:membrane protein implicated in regulation of membrane protease activity
MTNDQFMVWFTGFIVLAFFLAGVFDVLDYFIVKLVLFSCVSFVVANIYYVLFDEENKKSPEKDSE